MKRGFTLIELLAVIVILAIIALIAVPIVLNIVNDAKESAQLRSAEMYLKGVEFSIGKSTLNNQIVSNGTYKIMSDGNICLGYKADIKTCVDVLEVNISGETPKEDSTVTIVDGQIKKVKLKYGEKEIVTDENKSLTYFENEYKLGQKIRFNPGDKNRTWYVIDEDATTVTLILELDWEDEETFGYIVPWYEDANDNSYGPVTALNYLNSFTTNWDNVDPIESYTYINNLNGNTYPYGYQKLEIKNGNTTLLHKDGQIVTKIEGVTKARLLSLEEILEIFLKENPNLSEENLKLIIQNYIQEINETLDTSFTTVDEIIEEFSQNLEPERNYSDYIRYVSVINVLNHQYYIINESVFDFLPSFLSEVYAWTSTSSKYSSNCAAAAYFEFVISDLFSSLPVTDAEEFLVYPVITIPKSKLSQ